LSESGRLDEAEKALSRAVSLVPDDALAHYNRGVVRERKNSPEKALRSYSRALSLDPQNSAARSRRAWTLRKLGRLEEARVELEIYLERAPQDAHEWVTLGIVRSDLGAYADAEQAFSRALQIDPTNVSARFNSAITARRRRDLVMVARLVDELKRIAPDDRRTGWAAALLAAELGRHDEASTLYARALRRVIIEPDVPEGEAAALGEWAFPVMKKAGRAQEARTLFEEALRRDVHDARWLRSYARVFGRVVPRGIRAQVAVRSRGPGDPPSRLMRVMEVQADTLDEIWSLALDTERHMGQQGVEKGEILFEERVAKDESPFSVGVCWVGTLKPEDEKKGAAEPQGFEPESGWTPEDEASPDRDEGGNDDNS
jgi:tetratricopeptide (TPR) repeat protein